LAKERLAKQYMYVKNAIVTNGKQQVKTLKAFYYSYM